MRAKTVEKVMKNSIVYGYAVTQPFAIYIDAQPMLQDRLLAEAEKIQYGEHSEIVRHVQLKLKKQGYYNDKIDGVYGLFTEQAVKGFQSSEAITITGQIDQETIFALSRSEKKAELAKIKDLIFSISYGDHNEDVRKVQEVLYYYGYYKGSVDGIYGPLTDEAILRVKNENVLEHSRNDEIKLTIEEEQLNINYEQTDKTTTDKQVTDVIHLEMTGATQSIIQEARSYIGTPYVWGGTSPNGFDCSGFIQFVYKQQDIVIPRTVNEIWNFSFPIQSPSIGDLVFFETYQPGPSHLGIYLGNGDFIHAGSSRGVEVSNLHNNNYWKSKYLGAKRIP